MFKEGQNYRPVDQSMLEEVPLLENARGAQRLSPRQAARAGRVFQPVDKSSRPDFIQTGRFRGKVVRSRS